ncbi:hypothetical protein LJX96_03570 [Citrobacter freundii]|uniref:hypothetical protein n=1 Tax=Citrobacter portucalensis TaxID=1639133 RepID=UPI00226B7A10|nr:hypothetical protein [Citrobacter portucalensis]MCX9019834.1 hypothetical protein [Citrobacter portucalensis]UDR02455.1 hypothetical protein LJX96_03570 [Citrobacter freundii]
MGVFSVIDMYCFYLQKEKVEFDGIAKIAIIISEKEYIFIMNEVAKIDIMNNIDFTLLHKLPTTEARNKLISLLIEIIIIKLKCSSEKALKLNHVFNALKNKNFIFNEIWSKKKWNIEKKHPSRNRVALQS